MKFNDIKFKKSTRGEGVQGWANFSNGYEVSIVSHPFSYGGEKGLYEIGVFKDGIMCDPLGWGDDVKGWLQPEDVEGELANIKELGSCSQIVDHLK